MAKTKDQKQQLIHSVADKLTKSKAVVFADYRGLKMSQLTDLRNKLRGADAEFSVTKNTLLEISLKQAALPEPEEIQTGPTATLFSYGDEIAPIKILVKAFKDTQIGEIKAGILSGELLDSLSVIRLANLPTKLELQAKVVGSLASPLVGMVGVLQANLRNLVYALNQIKLRKEVTQQRHPGLNPGSIQ